MSDYVNKVICGDAFEIMKDIPVGVVDLILTNPPFLSSEVPKDYYEWLEDFIKLSLVVSPRLLLFNSSQRLVEICRKFPVRTVLIWDKKFTLSAFKYEPVFLFTRDENEKIWGKGRIYRTLFSYHNPLQREKKVHINQNPVDLYVELLRQFPKCNVILDPFLGSGTTVIACKRLKRSYIGIDISLEYCRVTEERLVKEDVL